MLGCILVDRFPLACELAQRPELRDAAAVVSTGEGRVWVGSEAAERQGVMPGQRLREATGRVPGLIVLEGRPALYRTQMEAISEALGRVAFSLEVVGEGVFLVDFTEVEPLHSSRARAASALLACVRPILQPRLGVAPSRFGAQAAARTVPPGGWRVVEEADLARFLGSAPVRSLPLSAEAHRRLRLLGLGTIEALAGIPRHALAAQLGREGDLSWEMVRGQDRHLAPRPQAPERVLERLRFEPPLVTREAVLVGVEQALGRVVRGSLRGRGARQASLRIAGERGEEWRRAVTFKEARAERARMWPPLRSILEEAQLPGAVVEVELELTALVDSMGVQLALPGTRPRLWERLEDALRQLKAQYGYCPVGKVVEVEPWSRVPEQRLALIDFDV